MTTPNAEVLTWVDPTTRTDGTPIAPDTFTIQVYDSLSPTLGTPIGTVAAGVQTFTTPALAVGVHVFTLTATDSEGDVSVASNSLSVTIAAALAAPSPPTALAGTPTNV
jgi:hypothetical protein